MESPSKITTNCLPRRVEPVGSAMVARVSDTLQSIIATRLVKLEDYFVQRATRHLANFGMTPNDSLKQQIISALHQHQRYWDER